MERIAEFRHGLPVVKSLEQELSDSCRKEMRRGLFDGRSLPHQFVGFAPP